MTLIDKAEAQSAVRAYLVHESSEIALNVEQIIAAIPARGVGVKPLVWEDFGGLGAKASAFYQANYLIQWWKGQGRYEVALSYPGYQTGYDGDRWHDTLEAAKAAAQADYAARILAALEPAAPLEAKPWGWFGGNADCRHASVNDLADGLHSCASCGAVRSAALKPTDPPEEIGILRARVEDQTATIAALRRELAMGRAAPTDAAQAREAAALVLDAMKDGEVWGRAVNAAMPIIDADLGQSAWATVTGVREAIVAALRAIGEARG